MPTYTVFTSAHGDNQKVLHVKRFRHGLTIGPDERKGRMGNQVIIKDTDMKLRNRGKFILGHVEARTIKEAKFRARTAS